VLSNTVNYALNKKNCVNFSPLTSEITQLMFTHQNQIFLEGHISAPKGCCAPKFLHALENDQVLLAHSAPGAGASLTTFFKGESKIGLKCNKGALITSELGGVARRNFGT